MSPIRDLIADRLKLPVYLDNDANVAMLAEHRFGAARGATNALMLTIGTGIGGGIIINGELYRGSTGAGAELGHVVIDQAGPPCQGNCPNRGCVEALASGTALGREGRLAAQTHPASALGQALAAGEVIDGKRVTDAALAGDGIAHEVVVDDRPPARRRAVEPRKRLRARCDRDRRRRLGPRRAAARARAAPRSQTRSLPPMNRTPVVAAELGPDAGMIGAAVMALEEHAAEESS